ncbi:TIGR02270 family protein [Myxococcus sp. SDU36]|uniref:TIGR02270 family protein n=1 Tax=Myxococcus sp. SDU36 TaxID=2831967 RepID=UPI002542D8F4|nr:TIGR02270 family protein [Myxococcus sp. SDU36]WIG94296.1 TIGR02270 family protein [Myxococcus sp. SDU36]
MQEHLDEAAFHWRQRERALASWEESLEEVAEGDEARLLAHVEGLVIGGAPVARRLLLPALEGEDLWQVGPAALALLEREGAASLVLLLRGLTEGPEESRPEIQRAFELADRSRFEALLLPQVARVGPEAQAMLLEVLTAWQADPGTALSRTLGAADAPALWEAALRAARFTARPVAEGLVRQGLAHAEDAVRCAALETGLILGLRESWHACRRQVGAPGEAGRLATLALASGGEPADMRLLLEAAEASRLREDVLWALGFSGRRVAAEALVDVMQREEAVSRLAAEAFAIITGLDLTEHLLTDELDDEAPSSAEEGAGEMGAATGAWRVPRPPGRVRAASVRAWWQKARTRFDERGRFVRGVPWSPAAVSAELTHGPACLRPVWALELAVRTRGALQVATTARAAFQLRQLQGLVALRLDSPLRGFDSLMTA